MKRSIWIAGGVVLVVLLLAGAAFVGGRLLNRQEQASGGSGSRMMVRTDNGGTMSSFEIEPSDELPPSFPDAAGIFLRREDNSLIIGTGNVEMHASDDGEVGSSHSGPEVEVVVTHDTTIYCDETTLQFREASEDGKIQQVLGPGSIEEIGANNAISVWGEQRGDRLFAEVLVYTAPMVLD